MNILSKIMHYMKRFTDSIVVISNTMYITRDKFNRRRSCQVVVKYYEVTRTVSYETISIGEIALDSMSEEDVKFIHIVDKAIQNICRGYGITVIPLGVFEEIQPN